MSNGAVRDVDEQRDERDEWKPPPPLTPEQKATMTREERMRYGLRPPWRKGQSGNPAGRTTRTLRELVLMELSREGAKLEPVQAAQIIADEIRNRNSTIIKAFMDREWPVVQAHLIGKATEEQTRQMAPPDMSRLSQDERETMQRLARKLIVPPAIDVDGEQVDDDEHEAADEGVGAA